MATRDTAVLILVGIAAAGCEGTFSASGDLDALFQQDAPDGVLDGGDPGAEDATAEIGDLVPDVDVSQDSPLDPAQEADSSDPAGDALSEPEPADPCLAVICWEHSHCVAGDCFCDDGYVDVGGACRTPDPTDPEARTEAQVCDRWRADYPLTASWIWNPGPGACDPGEVSDETRNDGVRRINLYRWLTGLDPVTRDTASVEAAQQACAIMMYQNGTINHSPPASWSCYTSEGATAAGSSNLAMGASTPADAIDMYIDDWGNETTMGHRRWILYPPYGSAGIGQASSFNCLHVFSWGGSSTRSWVAFPAPGPYPSQAVLGAWTFSSSGVGSSTTVTVIKESTGTDLGASANLLAGGYGLSTVSFDPGEATVGETYVVTVSGLSGEDIVYRVRIVDCSG
jgi:hypothetical protein